MPQGFCYFWNPGLVWLHVVSDSLIALSYYTLPVVLFWFVRRRRDLPFKWMFVPLGVFIIACGSTHLMEVWNIWHADYWTDGIINAITAVASVPTVILLARLAPQAAELPNLSEWIRANARLEEEVRERREIEFDLLISESNYREQAELLDLTHDAIFVRGIDRKVTYWNRASEWLYGWPANEVRGRVSNEVLQSRFPIPLAEIESEVFENGSWEGELVHRHRNGSEIVVSSRWALRRDAAGNPAAILESNRDVTHRVHEEQKFRNLLESAPDGMVIVGSDGCIQLVNAQTEKLFGYSRAELVGQPVEILIPQRFHGSHIGHRQDYSQSPRARAMGAALELFGLRKDSTEFPVEVCLSPLETSEGTLISSAIRDVTERRRSDESIQRLNAELRRRVAEATAVNKELESFSYSVSHDLRAPLRHIDGFARILQEEHAEKLSAEGRHHLDRILSAVTQMGRLVDDLLALARISRKEMLRERVNLSELVRQAVAELPGEPNERDIEWRIEPLPDVECDPGLLKLVFSNLLSNAVKFTRMRQPAVIEVGVRGTPDAPVFFVRDNGVGFDPRYADKLFGAFQRLHRQEDFEGTGIGLATVQRIIHRHGGEVRAEAVPGRGATFFFTLEPYLRERAPDGAKEVSLGRS
jgi:PAS domain S-box-containing protein